MTAITVTSESFDAEVLQGDLPVLIDVWGDDGVKCEALSGVIDALAQEFEGRMKVVKLWPDPQMPLVQQYQIMGILTLMLFRRV